MNLTHGRASIINDRLTVGWLLMADVCNADGQECPSYVLLNAEQTIRCDRRLLSVPPPAVSGGFGHGDFAEGFVGCQIIRDTEGIQIDAAGCGHGPT